MGDAATTTTVTTTTAGLGNTVSGIASRTKDLSTLVSALEAADLVTTLSDTGPFTVFAPTNEAFAKVPNATLTYLLGNKTALTEVLKYHVAAGDLKSTNLKNGEQITTLEGKNVTVAITGTTVKINDATVTTANVNATNGVVHIIDAVLLPPGLVLPTIPELAEGVKDLSTLVTALGKADLVTALSASGPFTVFAPTNDAFNGLPAGVLDALLKPENKDKLVEVLKYHVASGEVLSTDLENGEQIETLEKQKVNITIDAAGVKVNTANVTMANVLATNGVVHIIDAVLLPPGFVPPTDTTTTTTMPVGNTISGIASKNAHLSDLV